MNLVSIDNVEAHVIVDHIQPARSKIIEPHAVVCQDTKAIRISCAAQLDVEAILNVIQVELVSMEIV